MIAPLIFPAMSAAPGVQASWWASLDAASRSWAEAEAPDEIAAREGLPVDVRDRANRALLVAERARIAGALPEASDAPSRFAGYTGTEAPRTRLELKLAALDSVARLLDRDDDERRLLAVDTSGDLVETVLAVGPLETARHIVVVLGGVDTTAHASLGGMDDEGRRLMRTCREQFAAAGMPEESVAVVNFIYSVPRTGGLKVLAAAVGWKALPAAARLRAIVDGIREVRPGSHLTVFGHSYGSYAVGLALVAGMRPDDVLFLGSPGIGVRRFADLGMPVGRVFAVEAESDVVADLGWFGSDPASFPEIVRVSAEEGTSPDGVRREGLSRFGREAHARYQIDGAMSQYNMAVVAAGLRDRVVPDPDSRTAPTGLAGKIALYRTHGRGPLRDALRRHAEAAARWVRQVPVLVAGRLRALSRTR